MNEFIEAYKNYWKNYFNFSDRTSVGGYWRAFLCNFIIGFAVGIIGLIPILGAIISWAFSIACIIPGLAICIRRLRDAGKPWPFIFLGLIPCVGAIILIVFLVQPTNPAPEDMNAPQV